MIRKAMRRKYREGERPNESSFAGKDTAQPSIAGFLSGAILAGLLLLLWAPLLSVKIPVLQWFIPLLLIGGLIGRTQYQKILVGLAAITVGYFLVVTHTPLVKALVPYFIRNDSYGPVDAVVVLSSGVTGEGLLTGVGLERLMTGISLAKAGYTSLLVVTELPTWVPSARADTANILALTEFKGVLERVGPVSTTLDEAQLVSKLLADRHLTKILLVTSPLHTKRAAALFEAQGLQVISAAAPSRELAFSTLSGSRERIKAMELIVYENFARAKFYLRKWF